ncbi:MAG: CTP synthase [Deltaproteobacteria bacterium]|jgi:CTP synthase|nr:CTP synthase [Deltaproteobacteria bacterium]
MQETKFIFITGGVLSSLGKGLAGSSIAVLLKARGLKVTIQKLDPYINVDAGTMNPYQHGEVFVTDDGAETDLDLGHYERFLGEPMTQLNNHTTGSIYNAVIQKERQGSDPRYQGATIQVIPHITDEIKNRILSLAAQNHPDVAFIEIGGTVGDIESLPFLEAIRQLKRDLGKDRCFYLHLTLVPYLKTAGEHKTKPTQHSVKELRSIGIQPDIIICRCEVPVSSELKRKIALFCDVDADAVFSAVDVRNIYEVPLRFFDEGLEQKLAVMLGLSQDKNVCLDDWRALVDKASHLEHTVKIGVVGKYVELREAYKSLHEALMHGGLANDSQVALSFINSEEITPENVEKTLDNMDGILVPGGFGTRGIEGKVLAVRYARERKTPFFGICLGMQCAVVEFARNAAALPRANSEEFAPLCEDKVIYLMRRWYNPRTAKYEERDVDNDKGGTMRLGSYPCRLVPGSLAQKAYQTERIDERHRHRFEFNLAYRERLEQAGMIFSGLSPDGELVEIVEIKDHPWFLSCQFHPEFKSNPMKPHPLFRDFIKASLENRKG